MIYWVCLLNTSLCWYLYEVELCFFCYLLLFLKVVCLLKLVFLLTWVESQMVCIFLYRSDLFSGVDFDDLVYSLCVVQLLCLASFLSCICDQGFIVCGSSFALCSCVCMVILIFFPLCWGVNIRLQSCSYVFHVMKSSTILAQQLNSGQLCWKRIVHTSQYFQPGLPDELRFLVSEMFNCSRGDVLTLQIDEGSSSVVQVYCFLWVLFPLFVVISFLIGPLFVII